MNSTVLKYSSLLLVAALFFSSCKNNLTTGYTQSPNGLWYKIIVDNKQPKAQLGQYISYHVTWRNKNDSMMFNTESTHQPQINQVIAPQGKGDLVEIFKYIGPGDSASCLVPARDIFKVYLPNNMMPDELMKIDFKVIALLTQHQVDSIHTAAMNAMAMAKDKVLRDYMQQHQLDGIRTPDGMYVIIEKQGTGKQVTKGSTVQVDYTGRLLNGTEFDSSQKPGRTPYQFVVGTHSVIEGWDEGLPYFKAGGKGKLLIPSELAYGEHGSGPVIGPNEPLVFDIEVVSVK